MNKKRQREINVLFSRLVDFHNEQAVTFYQCNRKCFICRKIRNLRKEQEKLENNDEEASEIRTQLSLISYFSTYSKQQLATWDDQERQHLYESILTKIKQS
ncbi:hypothetical protein BMT55_02820 [Listeria newyorkensis]|uniref:Uncharacterized protein n=1 Tax=Listeria newyorkensis TaxID=1497681 RepID=A0ABX4XQ91_9LIST|nr:MULTISPECIES: hypothetical protein [Listeria]KGL42078.1 hypothetical protein EP56_10060 [Listeriaceae bacterium FSL A5-0209]KGL46147.1 hypothetical protein EP58_01980 [Listeria newyorkensis]PNP94435.1 hypothetical protein BMT55_02820 [Listeria newyorkensis]RQW67598.1 hypothetical protein DUK53_04570 [Listeria sp. SHR_NRA_18]WAO22848.1 hypothetical protein OTR81_06145 [Listeria newyorkensis]